MLKDVLNHELDTITIDALDFIDLDENMAAGVGCRGSSCAGSCTGPSGPP